MKPYFCWRKGHAPRQRKIRFFLSLMFWWTNFYIVMLEHSGLYSHQKCKQKFVYITKMAIQKGSHMKGSRPPARPRPVLSRHIDLLMQSHCSNSLSRTCILKLVPTQVFDLFSRQYLNFEIQILPEKRL